jgi:putative FmdB family regulatory protein
MPRYEFLCEKCQKTFELTMTLAEHEKGKVRCPTCKSTRVVLQLSAFMGRLRRRAECLSILSPPATRARPPIDCNALPGSGTVNLRFTPKS